MSQRPRDWPGPGPIDLETHDLPHGSSTTEWWYANGHLLDDLERRYSFFVAFFRQVRGRDPQTRQPRYAHSITWGISDVSGKEMLSHSGVDPSAPAEGLERLERGLGSSDERLNRALREILERGNVPRPDRLLPREAFVNLERLELDYAGDTFRKRDDGHYELHLYSERLRAGVDLTFEPLKPPIRHGQDGVVRGAENEQMFYYFIPRCRLTGSVTHNGLERDVREGQGWYDHEFGVGHTDVDDDERARELRGEALERHRAERRRRKEENAIGWNWLSLQLDDGTDLTIYPLIYAKSGELAEQHVVLIGPDGERSTHTHARFLPGRATWQSSQTFFEYPMAWTVDIPDAGLKLDIEAAFEDQEFITLISKPSFWEGRVQARGRHAGSEVSGLGYVERSGFTAYDDLDGFFDAVSKMVRKRVDDVLPLAPSYERARDLVASEEREQYMEGLDVDQYARTLIKPIREITDRGGKGWRSYAAITCCDLVGGDSRRFIQWLAVPELMHVGSLIVDDVQDKSTVRRGAGSAHLLYGEAQAINSGTAAYFVCNNLLTPARLSDADKLRIYNLYFESLRAGHAGQAIDLDGFDTLMPRIVENGDGARLEQHVLAVHRLKTAAPAGCLARMGAIAGNGTEAQIEQVGRFFEAVGLAFQIIDDVLNLRGFRGELKSKAEDVRHGKITLPVAKAMGRLDRAKREWLYEHLRSKPEDPGVVHGIVEALEACGAVDACQHQARQIVEDGWQALEPLVDDSLAKMMLRGFSWYVLERHY